MLVIISFSIPFSIIQKILFACFYANKNTRSPMMICVCSLTINLLLDILIIKIVGIYCVAISTTASAIISTIFGVYLLKKDNQYFANSKKLCRLLEEC
jgi:peptidoglycan biosynthesis protein MviN/MurJ (putative lipid II flippase)